MNGTELDDAVGFRAEVAREVRAAVDEVLEGEGAGRDAIDEEEAFRAEVLASAARAADLVARGTARVTVVVTPSSQRRVTGWDLICPDHGGAEQLAPTRDLAVDAAARHLDAYHGGRGDVKVRRPRSSRAKRGGRARRG